MKNTGIFYALLFFLITVQGKAQTSYKSVGIGGGGALFSPAISPHNSQQTWISCDMSAVYKSEDFGQSWNMQNAGKLQGNTNTCIQFTSNPQICYAIDHTPDNGSDISKPVKSTDGGTTWIALGNDPTNGEAYTLLSDPNSTDRILLSSYDALFFSSDGGQNFQQVYTFSNGGNGLHLAGAFFDGSSIYAGTSAGLVISINNGNTFYLLNISGWPSSAGMSSFCGAKQNGQIRLFAVAMPQADLYGGITGADFSESSGIYSCDGTSSSWILRTTGIAIEHKPFFIACSSSDINTVYTGGGDNNLGYPSIYKSINGAQNWTSVFNTSNNANIVTGWCGSGGDRGWSYPEYLLGLAVAPTDANKVIFTDLGFAHVTINGGTTWKQAYVSVSDENVATANTPSFKAYHGIGLENTSSWSLAWSDANRLFAGFSDINGIKSSDGGNSWSMAGATTLNSTYHMLKHSNGNVYTTSSSIHDIYQTTRLTDSYLDPGAGAIRFSTNNGSTWSTLHDFNHPVMWMAVDPNNTNRMYASVIHYAGGIAEGGIWKCDNISTGSASVWSKLSNPPRTEGHPFIVKVLNDGSIVASYCARRNNSGTFTSSSGVFILPSGSSVWIDRSDAGMLYYTKDLIVDANDATQNTWYACVWSGWGGAPNGLGGLYKTTNRGQSWTRIFSGADRVSSVTINPSAANDAWLSTETDGLWHCTNFNTSNPVFTRDNIFPFRQPERMFFNPYNTNELWITTFGGGLYKRTDATSGIKEIADVNTSVYPNPSKGEINIKSKEIISSYKITDLTGKIISEEKEINENEIKVLVKTPGVYLYEITSVTKNISAGKLVVAQ